jgi:putative ABC transport system permease protein
MNMSWLRRVFRKSQADFALDKELLYHLDRQIADYVASGMDPQEANRRARLEFGAVEAVKERVRATRWETRLENIVRDFQYALRSLRRDLRFALFVILTLALGIGATTAIFSVVHADLLRPLPYTEPSQLVWVDEFLPRLHDATVVNPEYSNWATNNQTFEALAGYDIGDQANLTGAGLPERIETASVTANFLATLRVQPALGRSFVADETWPHGPLSALLTDSLWRRKFSADRDILGKSIGLDGQAFTVVGVLPAGFQFPDKAALPECLLALQLPPKVDWAARRLRLVRVIGRLKPSATLSQARADLTTLASQSNSALPAAFAQMRSGLQVHVLPLQQKIVGDVRPALLVLLSAVFLVLLIACVNVANLQLVRTAGRYRELAVRAAVGASRARLIQQFMVEGMSLAAIGGTIGLLLAFVGVRLLRVTMPPKITRISVISLDLPVLLFALAITCFTAIIFGLAPAFRASSPQVNDALKDGGSRTIGHYGQWGFRSALVVAEFTFAFLLLIDSGLLIRSFVRLSSVAPGFDPANVLTVSTELPDSKYSTGQARLAFFSQILQRVQALPGVTSASLTTRLPFTPRWRMFSFLVEGQPEPPRGTAPAVLDQEVTPDYFQTMRIPLLTGRPFTASDLAPDSRAIVVSIAFAQQFLLPGAPLSKRVRLGPSDAPWSTVVGIVGDVRYAELDHDPEPQVYLPYSNPSGGSGSLLIRSNEDPRGLISAMRAQFAAVDPAQPVFDITTMQQRLDDSIESPKFNMALLTISASLALLLATMGIYGVISFFVSQRTHEIGIRVALGAAPPDILRLVLGQGGAMVVAGLMLGAFSSLTLTHYLANLLFGVRTTDLFTIVSVAALLVLVALAACYIPARRALRLDPMTALRYE